MSSLIPYAASELGPSAMDLGIAVGKSLGTAALNAGKNAFKKRAQKRTARRKLTPYKDAFSLNELGRKAGHQESKRNNNESPPGIVQNKTLYQRHLIEVEKDVAASEVITKRQRDTILHNGVKVCFTCKNVREEACFFNWAIIIPKAVNNVNSTDLLRGDSLERYLPMGTSNTFMDLRCAPINTDRYNVVMHKRMIIRPDSDKSTGAGTGGKGRDLVIVEKYIPTKRQLFFNGDTAQPLTNLYMVWWVDYYGSPTGSTSDTAEVSWKIINYFKDV